MRFFANALGPISEARWLLQVHRVFTVTEQPSRIWVSRMPLVDINFLVPVVEASEPLAAVSGVEGLLLLGGGSREGWYPILYPKVTAAGLGGVREQLLDVICLGN
jgi:hypothetical protein